MEEDVSAAVGRHYEAEPLLWIEELNDASNAGVVVPRLLWFPIIIRIPFVVVVIGIQIDVNPKGRRHALNEVCPLSLIQGGSQSPKWSVEPAGKV